MPDAPETYPRRVLLAVTGLSPQVVTETVYALTQQQTPPFIPTEMHLVTTAKGAERARLPATIVFPRALMKKGLRRQALATPKG